MYSVNRVSFIAAIFITLNRFALGQGVITTVAGSQFLFSGQGAPAAQAHIELPYGVRAAPDGSILFAAPTLNMVFRVTTDGIIHVVAGNGVSGFSGDQGPATAASLAGPRSVAADSFGNIFISDYNNGRIRKVSADGTITTVASGIASPYGIAVDPSGNVYYIEYFLHRVQKLAPSGSITTVAGIGTPGFSGDGGPSTAAALSFPADIALDSAGNLYIADTFNYRLREVNTRGIITTIAGNGQFGASGNGVPATTAQLSQIQGVAVDSQSNIYVGDINFSLVRRIDSHGIISTVAGSTPWGFSGDGGPALSAIFDSIQGVAVDSAGNLFIADNQNDRVRKVAANGIVSTFAGAGRYKGDGGPATQAHITEPVGVAVDSVGNLYISDHLGYVIRKSITRESLPRLRAMAYLV